MTRSLTTSVLAAAGALSLASSVACADAADELRPVSDHPALAPLVEHWTELQQHFNIPGFAFVVVHDGEVFGHFMGERDPGSGKPVDADTGFYIASITKTYTATAAAKLADQGVLDLEAPVQQYLPEFSLTDARAAREMKVSDLITHRAGLDLPFTSFMDAFTGQITDERYFEFARRYGNTRGHTRYANANMNLLGRVIERATGRNWHDVMRQEINEPLGMSRTTTLASEAYGGDNIAFPARIDEHTGAFRRVRHKTDEVMHFAGGHVTSSRDSARWLLHALGHGPQLLKPATLEAATMLQAPLPEPGGFFVNQTGFGYGWEVGTFRDRPSISHSGGYIGSFAYMLAMPEDDIAFAVLTNGDGNVPALGFIMLSEATDALLGRPQDPSMAEQFIGMAQSRGPTYAPEDPAPLPLADLPSGESALGTYTNDLFGTLRLEDDGNGGARLYLGQLEFAMDPHPAGFELGGDPCPILTDCEGNVIAVRVAIDGGGGIIEYPYYTKVIGSQSGE